jgi:ABC-type xylose transport system permease subunit
MGVLAALSAAVVAARLNGATLDIGFGYELYVIAAAVVGGTSFAGGIGTIPGAVLGAFVMQALAYGLSFMGSTRPARTWWPASSSSSRSRSTPGTAGARRSERRR